MKRTFVVSILSLMVTGLTAWGQSPKVSVADYFTNIVTIVNTTNASSQVLPVDYYRFYLTIHNDSATLSARFAFQTNQLAEFEGQLLSPGCSYNMLWNQNLTYAPLQMRSTNITGCPISINWGDWTK